MTVMACMTLQKAHMSGKVVNDNLVKNVKADTEGVEIDGKSVWESLMEGVLWNSSARLEISDGKDDSAKAGEWITKGNVTEQGLFKFFMGLLGG